MKSKDIRKIFNHSVNNFMITSLQYSGIKVSNNDLILDNGKKLEDDKYYTITTNDFMSSGGDGYDFSNGEILGEYGYLRDVVIKHFNKYKSF